MTTSIVGRQESNEVSEWDSTGWKKIGMSLKTTSHRTFRGVCCLLLLLISLWLWLLPAFSSTAVEESVLSDTPEGGLQVEGIVVFSDFYC